MALSPQFSTSNTYIKYTIECIQNSQNIANNTSNVTVKVRFFRTNTGYETYGNGTCYCKINGTTYSAAVTSSNKITNSGIILFTKTLDIPHNSDGSKSLVMSAWISHSKVNSSEQSYSQTLTSIPRTSTFSISSSSITLGSTQMTINISRASSSFNHKVIYKIGSTTISTFTNIGTSHSFTPSINDCKYITTSTSANATIVVETYNGSTMIGSNSKGFTVNVPSNVIPTMDSLNATAVAAGADPSIYGYVQSKSKVKVDMINVKTAYDSPIASYSITGGGFSSSSSSLTTDILNTPGNITFTAFVRDKRGRQSESKTITINVLEYFNPKISSFLVERVSTKGILKEEGEYVKITPTYSFANLGGKNALTSKLEYKQTGVSTVSQLTPVPNSGEGKIYDKLFASEFSFQFTLTIQDKFSSTSSSANISSAFVTMDFKAGGKGISIGKTSETDNLFEVAMDTNIIGKFLVNGKPIEVESEKIDWNNLPSIKINGDINGVNRIKLNANGGSWISGATNGNILPARISEGSFHPLVSTPTFSNHKVVIGGIGDKYGFYLYDKDRTENGNDGNFYFDLANKTLHTTCRTHINEWAYFSGGYGVYFSTHGGGLYMSDGQWVRVYGDKDFYTGGRIKANNALETRYIDSTGGQLDINAKGNTLFINTNAASGANLNINRTWSGSKGNEVSIYNSKGKGWGFIGNTENTFYRIYGAGGNVSQRKDKYDISKFDNELLYDYVKSANVYGYRTVSIDNETKERTNRSDMCIGCMVEEMPTEVVFYDNENGDGGAIDNYGYTTMLLGALKVAQNKIEFLENKIIEMEERINGIINNG